jgi:outer membrane murein-binding lipoprotein Lpp
VKHWKLAGAVGIAALVVGGGVAFGAAHVAGVGVQLCASPGKGPISLGTGGCLKNETALPPLATQNDLAAAQVQVAALQGQVAALQSQVDAMNNQLQAVQQSSDAIWSYAGHINTKFELVCRSYTSAPSLYCSG